jgi:hypothetical protein
MAKTTTIRGLLALALVALGLQASFAQVFWEETFSNQASATTNWVHGGTNDGAEVWTWTDDPGAGFQTPSGAIPAFAAPSAGGYFLFNSDANGEIDHIVTLTGVGNPANATGQSNVRVKFYTQYAKFTEGAIAEIGVSTNGTTFTYKPLFEGLDTDTFFEDWVEVSLPEANNAAQVWLQFRWTGNYEYHWKVDDVQLLNFVPAQVDVTFRVGTSTITVDPGGMRLAGSFNGWSDDVMTDEGNGVWSITKSLTEGQSYQYKFKNGPNGWEQAPQACGVSDGFGGFNRGVTVPSEATVLPLVCINSCDPCPVTCGTNPSALICDNFESYNIGNVSPQAAHWIPWDLNDAANNIVGAEVSADFASDGTKSMKVKQDGAAGDDQLLKLGNKSAGRYSLKWKYYIPVGKAAYFNIQTDENAPGASSANFAAEVYFRATGVLDVTSPTPAVASTYPQGEWFDVELVVDLDNNLAKFFSDGAFVRAWAYTGNFGAIDFYAADATFLAYVDQVEYSSLPSAVYNVDICDAAVDLTSFFSGVAGVAQTTGLYDNTTATVAPTDPVVDCWNEGNGVDILNGTMWYTFTGDGGRYFIQTVPCNATNYIGTAQQDPGDTQMTIYTGDDCTDLTEVACNDDFFPDGAPDWRAGLDLETTSGQNYFMLIDGFEFQGTLATGEFCIEITEIPSLDCSDGVVGTLELSNGGFVCFEGNLNDIVTIGNDYVLPNLGPVSGLAWCITTAPLPTDVWPGLDPSVASTPVAQSTAFVGLPNVGPPNGFAFGVYYLTPVVVGGGTVIDPTIPNRVFNVDVTNGCFFVGESQQLVLLPLTDDVTATAVVTNGSVNLTPAGGTAAELGDPTFYEYEWSNGATTQDVTGLAIGTHTCIVSDPAGCSESATVTVTVTTVSTKDPTSVQSLVLSPNPTASNVTLTLSLDASRDVRVEVVNTLGQALQTIEAGNVSTLSQQINLARFADGTYFLRVTVDGETALRRVVLQR